MHDFNVGAAELTRPGFEWSEQGLSIWANNAHGQPVRVTLPLHRVVAVFEAECHGQGCPLEKTVGDMSVGGFFSKIGRSFKKFKRKVMRSGIGRAFKKVHSIARKVAKVASKVVRSKVFRGIAAGLAVAFPVLAPGVMALEAANAIANKVEKAKGAAKAIKRGIRGKKGRSRARRTVSEGRQAAGAVKRALQMAERGSVGGRQFAGAWAAIRARRRSASRRPSSRVANMARMRAMKARYLRRRRSGRRRVGGAELEEFDSYDVGGAELAEFESYNVGACPRSQR